MLTISAHARALRLLALCGLLVSLFAPSSLAARTVSADPRQTPFARTSLLQSSISDAAYQLLTDRVTADRSRFFVYQDADSGFNHGFPSGFFGTISAIHLDPACIDDPSQSSGCAPTGSSQLDTVRGTVLRISFDPLASGQFAGVNIEEPENYGAQPRGSGYDLRGATNVVFEVRSPTPGGVSVQFGVAQHPGAFVTIPQSSTYSTMSIPLSSLGLSAADLASVHILFSVAINDVHAPQGGTILLDNIRFEPVPTSQQSVLTFPLANQTFGVVPVQQSAPGRVPIPPDQLLRNLTTTYESALALVPLLTRATPSNVAAARVIADTFDYALHHDSHGDPLPVAPDGSVGLHNGYESGDIALLNSQGPGKGQAGDVRLAGFSASQTLCGPSQFCLVLDGATGGNNAFAILALATAYRYFQNPTYLADAETIGSWLAQNLTDTTGTGYGGYYLGYPDEGQAKIRITSKSVENNADLFAAFTLLSTLEQDLGHGSAAATWTQRANVAGDFVMQMFEPVQGRFYGGTVPFGTPAGQGITPDGPQRGGDVINTADFLDSDSFTTLALARAPRYHDQIDWRRPAQYILNTFAQTVTAGGHTFQGFSITSTPTAGPAGIAWEFTGQVVELLRFVDTLYGETRFEAQADFYLGQIQQAQQWAPFTDRHGLVAATLQDGDQLPPIEQCLSTPFQCIPERVGLAATTWAVLAEQRVNPLLPPNVLAGAGWNLVGGSPLTLWPDSDMNWSFDAAKGQWYQPTGAEPAGTGTWEYVSTPGMRTVYVQPCSGPISVSVVAYRWNMVGNPCSVSVSLPIGARAYLWDAAGNRYGLITNVPPGPTSIPAGAAAWVKPTSSSLSLTP